MYKSISEAIANPQELRDVKALLSPTLYGQLEGQSKRFASSNQIEWKMVKGDIMRSIGGAYTFTAQDPNTTKVTYDVSVDLVIPLPGFIKRRAEVRIVNTLRELKALLES